MNFIWRTSYSRKSVPRICEATKALARKAQKKCFKGLNGIRTHHLRDNSAMLFQLDYEAGIHRITGNE